MTKDKSLVKRDRCLRLFSSRRQPPLLVDVRDLHVLENIGMSFHFKFAANPILSFGLRSGLGAEPKGLPSVVTKDDVSKLCQEKLPVISEE